MRRITAFFIIFSVFIGAGSFAFWQAPKSEKLRAAVDLNFSPYAFVDDHGKEAGYIVDLTHTIAKHINANVDIISANGDEIFNYLKSGKIDFAPLIAKNPPPPDWVVLGDTHTIDYDAIFIHRDEEDIHSEDDLNGRRAIVVKDSFAKKYLDESGFDGEMIVVNSIAEGLSFLKSRLGDVFLGPQMTTLAIIQAQNMAHVRMAPEPRFGPYTHRYAFAVRAGNEHLLNILNLGLKNSIASGEHRYISDKWLRILDPEQRRRQKRQRNLVIAIIVTASAAVILAGLVLAFKSEVDRKTRSLIESEQRFRNLVENLPGAVFRFRITESLEWVLEYVSDAIERITGYPVHEFTEKRTRSLGSMLHPEDFSHLDKIRSYILERGRSEDDFRIVNKNGDIIWVHCRARTRTDATGKVVFVDGFLFDITEQKRVSELLMKQQSRMASSARLSALGEMAGGIAHEINNPLAIISLRTHQLAQLVRKGNLAENQILGIVEGIEKTVDRISKIIKSLQIVARESEHDPFEIVSLKSIVNDTLELCLERMKKHGIEIIVDDGIDIELECRRVQISQVLLNLMNNAFDALIGLETRYIKISARVINANSVEQVEISVTDSGNGISREMAHKIFQPFFTTKGPGKGTGLGLSISKGMIESHDGFMWLDTDHPTTRFVIVLPRHQMKARDQVAAAHESTETPKEEKAYI